MKHITRRSFVRNSALALGAASLAYRGGTSAWAQVLGSNDAVRVGIIGLGWKGGDHLKDLLTKPEARVVALCDVDSEILARQVEVARAGHANVFATTDPRRLLERNDVDAVVIATPNHWHALLTVWACQAGKDVYVEKPVSHSVWEGTRMVEAAKHYGRVVQAGTQTRSDQTMPQWQDYIREGHTGKVQWIHAVTYKMRGNIGLRQPWLPAWLDYDLYCGPAPVTPLRRDKLHYDWHWSWETGNGDLANLGVHQLDIAAWLTGQEGMPRRILSLGGRYVHEDAAQTPNVQITVLDYPDVPMIFENRGLPAKPGVNYFDHVRGCREGIVVQCENGYFTGYHGGSFFDHEGKRVKQFQGDGGAKHMGNFLEAVRSRKPDMLAAPIATGHRSTAKCLYGNISYRVGRPAPFAEVRESVSSLPFVVDALESARTHLEVHGADLEQKPLTVGPWLYPDSKDGIARIEGADNAVLASARELLRDPMREGYRIPEKF
ncbi:MAG: Gfo/Idh/MocA family oxidoreductase [Opitutus sp.]|nr:Gfo/Idh/MocA family oxidoreductase [Opitutus sp.]